MKKEKGKIIDWIKKYFEENGKNCKAVVGISGGTDSSVVAALCVAALGQENVIGVLMPKGTQHDIDFSKKLVEFLQIKHYEINVEKPVNDLKELIFSQMGVNPDEFDAYKTNQPARIRMAVLYGISAIIGGRVAAIYLKIMSDIQQNLEMPLEIFRRFPILQKLKCES